MSVLYYLLAGIIISAISYKLMPYRADPDKLLYGTIVFVWPIWLIVVFIIYIFVEYEKRS